MECNPAGEAEQIDQLKDAIRAREGREHALRQARQRFPDRDVHLTGEIIHNPHVNAKLQSMGIGFLSEQTDALDRLGQDPEIRAEKRAARGI